MIFVYSAVREDDNIGSFPVYLIHFHKQTVQSSFQLGALIIGDGNHCSLEAFFVHIFQLHKVCIGQDRVVDLQHLAVLRCLFQQVAVFSYIDGGAGDDLLTDGVDRRIGYLGKQLFKVIKQWTVLGRKHCQRCIGTHCRNGF